MSKTVKAYLITFLIFSIIYLIIVGIFYFFNVKENKWVFVFAPLIASIISPRIQKVRMQSGDKLIVKHNLSSFFMKKDK